MPKRQDLQLLNSKILVNLDLPQMCSPFQILIQQATKAIWYDDYLMEIGFGNCIKMSKQCIINYYVIEHNNIIRLNCDFSQDVRSFVLTPQYFLDKFRQFRCPKYV